MRMWPPLYRLPIRRLALAGGLWAALATMPWGFGDSAGAALAEVRNPSGVAVIIGNKDYSGVGAVRYAHRDAEAFKRYVVDVLGFDPRNVRYLSNASQAQLLSELGTEGHPGRLHRLVDRYRKLSEGVAVSDVVVFYSGHGMPSLNPATSGSYLLPVDVDAYNPEINGYSLDLLYRKLSDLPARSVSVFLDACFSGFGGDGAPLIEGSPVFQSSLPESVSENMVVLTAADANQVAHWDEAAGHGMFTHHLLDALYGGGDGDGDGKVTAGEARLYLAEHLWRAVFDMTGREQDAVLIDGPGTGATVLAAAQADGAFLARPALGDPEPAHERAAGDEGGKADPARIVLPDGHTVADWALLAELRLEQGEHVALLAEANRHIRAHGALAALTDIREQAIAGLVADIPLSTKAEAREALTRIAKVTASAGERPDLLRLEARAHRLLGDYSSAAEAYGRWLQAAPQSHPERRDVLSALAQARHVVTQRAQFSELLGRPFSADTREGGVDWTDLHYAAVLNLPGVVTALIDGGMAADMRLKSDNSSFGEGLEQRLAGLGVNPHSWAWNQTPLHIAAKANARAAAEALVSRGADIEARDNGGSTPLHKAALGNARETAEWLVSRGADIEARDNADDTPLHEAAWGRRARDGGMAGLARRRHRSERQR